MSYLNTTVWLAEFGIFYHVRQEAKTDGVSRCPVTYPRLTNDSML